MRLRTFTAPTIPKAMAEIKAALGDDAIILSTKEEDGFATITAAVDADSSPPNRGEAGWEASTEGRPNNAPTLTLPLLGRELDELRYDVQHHLRFHNVPDLFIAKMAATLSDTALAHIAEKSRAPFANESRHLLAFTLEHVATHYLRFVPPDRLHSPVLMLAGPAGIGKTLAIAKLATELSLAGEKLLVISTDANRAGGADQLKSFTDILGVPMQACANKKSLANALKLVKSGTRVLIDTAGCNPYSPEEVHELKELASLPGLEVALALPAGIDPQEAIDVAEALDGVPFSRLIATKADAARRMGGVLTVSAAQRLPFAYASASGSVADPLVPLTAKTLAQLLLKP